MSQSEPKTISADAGLTGLGLLMQVSGSIFLVLSLPLLIGTIANGYVSLFLFGVLSVLRSSMNLRAGIGLLYGAPKGPLHRVWIYVGVALLQSLTILVLPDELIAIGVRLALSGFLMAWPVALAIVLSRTPFRQIGETLPRNEDLGFEAAGIIMTIFGILGVMVSSLLILSIYPQAPSLVWLGGFVLLVRSILHTKAGLRSCRGASTREMSKSVAQYTGFAIISSIVVPAGWMVGGLIQGDMDSLEPFFILGIMGYFLLAWPLLLRAFFKKRNLTLLDDENATTGRAPDMGLTALGWILLALGSLNLASSLGSVLFLGSPPHSIDMLLLPEVAGSTYSLWLSVGLATLQTVAGVQLIHMRKLYKIVTTLYASASIAGILYLSWPLLTNFSKTPLPAPGNSLILYGMLMISLAVAVSSLLLVHRRSIHSAQALITT